MKVSLLQNTHVWKDKNIKERKLLLQISFWLRCANINSLSSNIYFYLQFDNSAFNLRPFEIARIAKKNQKPTLLLVDFENYV